MLCWYEFIRLPGGGSIWTIVFLNLSFPTKVMSWEEKVVSDLRSGWWTDLGYGCSGPKFEILHRYAFNMFLLQLLWPAQTASLLSVHFWRYYKLLPLFCRIYFMSPKKMGDIQPFFKTREYGRHCYRHQPLKDKIPWTPVLILSMSTQVLSWVLRNDDKWIWFSNKLQPLTTSCN